MHDEQNCSQNFRENVKIQKLVFDEYFVKLIEYHSALVAWKSSIKSDEHFFRQINVFTKEVTKELFSRKFFERDRVF